MDLDDEMNGGSIFFNWVWNLSDGDVGSKDGDVAVLESGLLPHGHIFRATSETTLWIYFLHPLDLPSRGRCRFSHPGLQMEEKLHMVKFSCHLNG